ARARLSAARALDLVQRPAADPRVAAVLEHRAALGRRAREGRDRPGARGRVGQVFPVAHALRGGPLVDRVLRSGAGARALGAVGPAPRRGAGRVAARLSATSPAPTSASVSGSGTTVRSKSTWTGSWSESATPSASEKRSRGTS